MADARGKHVPPATYLRAFTCPHCGTFAQQAWHTVLAYGTSPPHENEMAGFPDPNDDGTPRVVRCGEPRSSWEVRHTWLSECSLCAEVAIWVDDRLVWPKTSEAPRPNPDLPDDVRADYDEAGTILAHSPRGAAALLRLAIQKLCKHLGEKGENLNRDIGELVKKGLDPGLQEAFDIVRVTGNNAVHPGEIDVDDRATAETLFG